MASLQAALVSNGIALVIVLMLLTHWKPHWRGERPQTAFSGAKSDGKEP
jgi:hypothetical protein